MRKLRLVCLAVFILAAAAAVVSAAAWQVGAAEATEAAGAAAAEVTNADYVVEYEMSLNNVVVSTERSMIVNDDQRLIISSEINMTAPQPLKMRNMLIINNFTSVGSVLYGGGSTRGGSKTGCDFYRYPMPIPGGACSRRTERNDQSAGKLFGMGKQCLDQLMYLVSGFNWAQEGGWRGGRSHRARRSGGRCHHGRNRRNNTIVAGAIKAQVLIPTTMSLLSVTIDRGIEKITIEEWEQLMPMAQLVTRPIAQPIARLCRHAE